MNKLLLILLLLTVGCSPRPLSTCDCANNYIESDSVIFLEVCLEKCGKE